MAVAVIALLAMSICIGAIANSGGSKSPSSTPTPAGQAATASTPAPATPAPAATKAPAAAPTAAPGPRTLLDLQGSGIKNSDPFAAPGQWKLSYSYDCSKFGSQGNFQVYVYDGANLVDVAVNELGPGSSGSTTVYHSGNLHLQMNSECAWSVKATTG